jgi:hypothetical protein
VKHRCRPKGSSGHRGSKRRTTSRRSSVDVSRLVPIDDIRGDTKRESALLREMAAEALDFVAGQAWAAPARGAWFGLGVGDVVGVFLVEFARAVGRTDRQLWVVVGDLPSAYLVTDHAPTATAALREYCVLMERWAQAVLDGRSLQRCFPVEAPATSTNARSLLRRVRTLRDSILPALEVPEDVEAR